jgi:periplasmic divalent cation tolerance protein
MGKYIQVFTSAGNKKDAERIAGILIEKKLAGCVQIVPAESRYRWKGKIEKSREYLCIIKSRQALYKKIEKVIKANHPYETPEIISVTVSDGSADYINWLEKETRK